jgi:predicted dehydrogenase
MKITRRKFVAQSALAGTAIALQPIPIFSQGLPSRKINVAVMGVRSRGGVLAENFAKMPETTVTVICDVDQRYGEQCVADISKIQGKAPRLEKDIRKVLEDKTIDALAIAAPDHWHAPAAILAVKAGKHVYLEKPCSHNPREGELLVEAQKKYGHIIHMGNQRRSWNNIVRLMDELHGGLIGNVYFAKGWYANNRESIGKGKPVAVPDYLDWDLWQGPAPRTDYHDNYHPYNWHWFTRWGTGEALNNGTHEIDVMRWGMGLDYPSRVVASGGKYGYDDDWQFPDTGVITYDFDKGKTITWEQRSRNNYPIEADGRGVVFYGEKGTVVVVGNGYRVYDNGSPTKLVSEVKAAESTSTSTNAASPDANLDGVHIKNFLDGIRSGQATSSPIDEGHKSVLMCQLGNIAWQTGRVLQIDQNNGHILNDEDAMKLWGREYEPGWEVKV